MKIKGRVTTVESVEVDIDKYELSAAVVDALHNKYPKFKTAYVSKEGRWMVEDGYNGHNGDVDYKDCGAAMVEEIEVQHLINTIYKELRS